MRERIGGRYAIEQQLGRGGMASVYRVRDLSSGHTLALKQLTLRDDATRRHELAGLFEREYHTLAQLSHPRVVAVYDYGLSELGPYYTMELLDGGDLRERAPLPWRDACALILDVCSPLALIHSRRLVHRDISPRNIRCTQDGTAKLIDFGAMVPMGRGEHVVGTPPFVAPEVVHRTNLDGRTDLFSLGASLYFAVTGRSPFTARDFAHLQESWAQKPALPSTLVADLPAALDALIMSLLSIEPAQRPRTVFEVMQRLSAIAEMTHVEPLSVSQAYLATPVMVGRDAALSAVRRRIVRALNRNGGALLMRAEPGGGRSRMLDAAVLEAKTLGARVLRAPAARGGGRWTELAEGMLSQLLETLPEVAVTTARGEGVQNQLFTFDPARAVTASVPDAEAGQAATGGGAGVRARRFGREQTLRDVQSALSLLLARLSRRYTLVLIVDDVDELEDAAVGLLAAISQQAERNNLLLIGTTRQQDAGNPSIALEVLRGSCEEISLPALSREETQELLESVFGDVPNVGLLADRVFTRAAGNPAYSMDLAQHLVDQRLACYSGGGWTLPSQLDLDVLPASVEQAFRERRGALSTPARTLAEVQALSLPKHAAFEREDYVALLPDLPPAEVDLAIGELLAKQVIASDGRTHLLAQKGWIAALTAPLTPQQLTHHHGRLAEHFERTYDAALVTVHHLLCAGLQPRAIDQLLALLKKGEDISAMLLSSEIAPAQVAEIAERAYDTALRLGRRPREVAELRQLLLGMSVLTDSRYYARVAADWLAQLEHESGLSIWRDLHAVQDPTERLTLALTRASERYGTTPEAERIYRVDEAIKLLVYFVVVSIAIGTRAQDARLLGSLPELLAPFAKLSPLIDAIHQNAIASWEVCALGRMEAARKRWIDVFERLDSVTGAELQYVEQIRAALAYGIGLIEARLGLTSALRWAELLDQDILQKVNAMYLRRVVRLQQGDAQGAEQCRRQAELLELQATARQMFSSTIAAELVAYALAADLTGVKQAADRIAGLAETHPGWCAYALLAQGLFQLLRGDLPAARSALTRCLALLEGGPEDEPRALIAWPSATAAYLETLVAQEEYEAARAHGIAALARCGELAIEVAAFEIERALALAEARLHDYAGAAKRLETVIERQQQLGVSGLPLGASYEARARIAIWAGDERAVETYARLAAQEYRHGRGSPLGARYERLMDEARKAGVAVLPQLTEFESTLTVTTGMTRPHDAAALVTEALDGAPNGPLRLARALELLCEARGASAGHLYLAGPDGLSFAASYRNAPPHEALHEFMRDYFARELAADDYATGLVTDSAVRSMATTSDFTDWLGTVHHPVLLSCQIGGEMVHVGLAALSAIDRRHSATASNQLLSAIAARLVEAGDTRGVRARR